MSLAKKVVDHPILTTIVFALLGIMALYAITDVALSLMPDMNMPVLMVSTTYPSAGPESVEKSVTSVLETSLVGVTGLKTLTSTSDEGSSSIKLEFEYGTDLDKAGNDVRDKIDQVKSRLPDDAGTPAIMKIDFSQSAIIQLSINGSRSAEDLKEIAENYIVDQLQQADGVAQASATGGRTKIIRVEISQNRLEAYGLTMTGVASALSMQNLELGGGKIGEGTKNYIIRTIGEYSNVDEINDTIIANKDGYVVRLSDVGKAFAGFKNVTSYTYLNGVPGVYVSISKQSDANTVNVAKAVYSKLDNIRKTLPADVTVEVMSDSSEQVNSTLQSLLSSAWQGAVLAMLILLLFLRNIKSTLIMGISIPFSIMITLLCMKFAGITLNMMTMTGLILGVGMVVDASVVVLENIYQYRERGTKPTVAAVIGTQEMFASVFSGNLTTVCVFIPFIFFKKDLGMIGQILPDLIYTIVIALLSSLFVALFLVPVLTSKFLVITPRKDKPLKSRLLSSADRIVAGGIGSLTNGYRKALGYVMRHRLATVITVVGMFVLSCAYLGRMNIVMMPGFQDESVTLSASLPIGTNLEETNAVLLGMEEIIRSEVKGYESITTSVGSGGRGESDKTYSGSIEIGLPDAAEQIDGASAIQRKLRAHFDDYPSVTFSFGSGMMGGMMGSDIDIALRSDDLDAAYETAQSIKQIMKDKVSDVSEATVSMTEGLPQVEVIIDRDRAYSFGVNVASIAKELSACVDGITATTYREAGNEYDVTLMLREEDRSKIPDLERIYVTGNSGRVALSNFATLTKGVGPVSIDRENQSRIVHVTASILTNRRANEVETDIQSAIDDSIIIPESVSLSYEGSWQSVIETGMVFLLIISMALLLVYGVMAGTYESFKDPFINMFTIPLSLIGVVAIYAITGQTMSMFTAFGFVMLVGIAVNNGIILVDQTNLLVSRGVPMRQACIDAGTSRLRPVLMTTLTTLLGMLPMAFFPSGNSIMLQPIALCVFGGLTSSTLITLLFIPVLYSIVNDRFKGRSKRADKTEKAVKEAF